MPYKENVERKKIIKNGKMYWGWEYDTLIDSWKHNKISQNIY